MASPIVRTESPPEQDAREVIRSWRTNGYRIWLAATGGYDAAIMCAVGDNAPEEFGEVGYDEEYGRHVVEWNGLGRSSIEQNSRDLHDTEFYYALAKWMRYR
ncbi:hypothetical protein [Glycomyces sp. NPDC048151]|uniref:hypothetical protein n=1 Tax=Glycomyces sp. NPDC048151 TaxID=3364002 RepID=UPI003717A82E